MRMIRRALLGLVGVFAIAASGCGSKCGPACDVLSNTQCPHVQFNGKVRTTDRDSCVQDCESNNQSICDDSSNSATNAQVLDCVAAVSCQQSATNAELALGQCVAQCPTRR
jgi:hypothetical protein